MVKEFEEELGNESGKEKLEGKSKENIITEEDKDDNNIEFRNDRLFIDAVMSGNWDKCEKFIKENRDMVKAINSGSGNKAFHVAIRAGHVHSETE